MIIFWCFFFAIGGAMAVHDLPLTTSSRTVLNVSSELNILNVSSELNISNVELYGEDFRGYNQTDGAAFLSHQVLGNWTITTASPIRSVDDPSFQRKFSQAGYGAENVTTTPYSGRLFSRRRSLDELKDTTAGDVHTLSPAFLTTSRSSVVHSNSGYERNAAEDITTSIVHYFTDEGMKNSGSEYYYPEKSLAEPWMIVRHEGFSHAVYRVTDKSSDQDAYFFPPALIVRPNSARLCPSSRPNRPPGITLAVEMWSVEYEQAVVDAVRKKLNSTQEPDVRLLSIQFIRVGGRDFEGLSVPEQWMSYAGQPAQFDIRINCESNATCYDYVQFLNVDPETFVHDHHVKLLLNLDPRKQKVDMESHLKAPKHRFDAKEPSTVATTLSTSLATTTGVDCATYLPPPTPCTCAAQTETTETTATTTHCPSRPTCPASEAMSYPPVTSTAFVVENWTANCSSYVSWPNVRDAQSCAQFLQVASSSQIGYYKDGTCYVTRPGAECTFRPGPGTQLMANHHRTSKLMQSTENYGFDLKDKDGNFIAAPFQAPYIGNATACLELCKAYPPCNVVTWNAHWDKRCYLKYVKPGSKLNLSDYSACTTYLLDSHAEN